MFYLLARFFFRLYFWIYHRLSIRGLDELEKYLASSKCPVVLAANHESYLDPPLVGAVFPRPLRFVAWDGLFKAPLFSALISALGAVPVNQENKASAAGLLRQVMSFIEGGFDVLIFPEGQRSPDGNLLPLEGGVSLIASKTKAPIVPVWIDGTWEAFSLYMKFPKPRKVIITFGTPISPEELTAGMPEKDRRNALLDSLQAAFENLRDQTK
jgi:1-acyl-sn-glycerol-3-phosphate acyltransferase